VPRRPGPARRGDGDVRRHLSLVSRCHRRNPQLAGAPTGRSRRRTGRTAGVSSAPVTPPTGSDAIPAGDTGRREWRVWARIGLQSFGGPAAQIAVMHRVLVEEQCWLDEPEFLRALGFCMLLPGPEAMQLATYAGWRRHGVS